MADSSSRRSALPRPQVGLDTRIVMDRAVVDLADRRLLATLDPSTQLHLLASLVAQAESWLGEQVAAAREDGASWAVIGRLLDVTATEARQRYGARPATSRPARQLTADRHADRRLPLG